MEKQAAKKPKRTETQTRSGTAWTEADYAAKGYKTIKLRLQPETIETLDRESARSKQSRQSLVDEAVAHRFKKKAR